MFASEDIIYYFSVFSCITLFIAYGLAKEKVWFLSFMLVGLITDLTVTFTGEVWVYHFYHMLEFMCLSMLFYKEINQVTFKKWIRWSFPLFLALFTGGIFIDGFENPSIVNMCLSSTVLILYSLYYLRQTLYPPFKSESLLSDLFFWLNSALLVYFSGLIISLSLHAFFEDLPEVVRKTGAYSGYIVNNLFYVLLIIGITCRKLFK